ncbi:reverse gyrase [Thermogladius sp. 4427co]|uniref:reverse gyrase n=1 Tax=Thermogladius sp. 4427co TaxID=3450718 RepID=UPI003F7A7F14
MSGLMGVFLDKPLAIYRHACPNCGRDIDDLRLIYRAPCKSCLRDEDFVEIVSSNKNIDSLDRLELLRQYYERLVNNKDGGGLEKIIREEELLKEFEEFFAKATKGSKPSSAQRTWARRVLKGVSFTIVAPTGMGKTLFSLVISLFIVSREQNSKIILGFPTVTLLVQAVNRLKELAGNAGLKVCGNSVEGDCIRIVYVHGRLSKDEKAKATQLIQEGSFNILLATNRFIQENIEQLSRFNYKLIIMDDVDAVLRSRKSVATVLRLVGLTEEDIEKGIRLVKIMQRLAGRIGEEEREGLTKEFEELQKYIEEVRKRINTTLVVNTATGRPRGLYPKLFKVFMGFIAGSRPEALRNIVDIYVIPSKSIEEEVASIVEKLGEGGLVYVPVDKGVEYAEYLAEFLRKRGIRAEAFHSKKPIKILSEFEKGNIGVLVGVAIYYGTLVRGIDMPARIRYAVFAGVPRHKFSAKLEDISPFDLLRLLSAAIEFLEGDEKKDVEKIVGRLSNRLKRISTGALARVREEFKKAVAGEQYEETPLVKDLIAGLEIARKLISREDIKSKLSAAGEVAFVVEGDKQYIMIPDHTTYIQASGRTSRLYPGGLTKGLSIIIVDDQRLLRGLERRLKWVLEDFQLRDINEVRIVEVLEEIDRDRKEVQRVLRGEVKESKVLQLVKSALLIVESPNKARTISRFFGRPSIRVVGNNILAYEVATGNYVLTIIASGGHVYDLVPSRERDLIFKMLEGEKVDSEEVFGIKHEDGRYIPIFTDIKVCDDGKQTTEEPGEGLACEKIRLRKLDIVNMLRELASEVDIVLIGTDPDTEGEKIAWDLTVLLSPYAREIKRVRFHEITRKAILNAILNPEEIDLNMVKAQIVRRLDDRWVGFTLSAILQKYFWAIYCSEFMDKLSNKGIIKSKTDCCIPNYNLSAGRVQSPVLKRIVNLSSGNKKKEKFRLLLTLAFDGVERKIELKLKDKDVNAYIAKPIEKELEKSTGMKKPEYYKARYRRAFENLAKSLVKAIATDIKEVKENINPPPPFTTDTLLAEASRLLGFSASKTMNIAQELFEIGLITYHRTDSTRVSDAGISIARQYIEEKYGDTRLFEPRSWGTGGAHECIRPTRPIDANRLRELVREGVLDFPIQLRREHYELYDLIFRRFIASQMKAAKVVKQTYKLVLCVKTNTHTTCDKGVGKKVEVEDIVEVIEPGYLNEYKNIRLTEKKLPLSTIVEMSVSDAKLLKLPEPTVHDIIQWMKEEGIGRPSTYAKILSTLIDRGYVKLVNERTLIALPKGIRVAKFLYDTMKKFIAGEGERWYKLPMYGLKATSELEAEMDKVALGKRDYQEVLNMIYSKLVELIYNNTRLIEELKKEYDEIARKTCEIK